LCHRSTKWRNYSICAQMKSLFHFACDRWWSVFFDMVLGLYATITPIFSTSQLSTL
jgi:hypothetical protein